MFDRRLINIFRCCQSGTLQTHNFKHKPQLTVKALHAPSIRVEPQNGDPGTLPEETFPHNVPRFELTVATQLLGLIAEPKT